MCYVLVITQFVSLGMRFDDIIGHEAEKKALAQSVASGRIPHAQLFEGADGCGLLSMALAYANALVCKEEKGENAAARIKANQLIHPDIHLVFPTATTTEVTSKPTSTAFVKEWRQFVHEYPYGTLYDWSSFLGVENKQAVIGVNDALQLMQRVSLKSFEGGWKCVIVWHAEKLTVAASNKLLKSIEEPPAKTLFLLLCPNENQLIDTIRSRCQRTFLGKIPSNTIAEHLKEKGASPEIANAITVQAKGNLGTAIALFDKQNSHGVYEDWFVAWVRTAFRAKGNKGVVLELTAWSQELSAKGVETQKEFIGFAIGMFRFALLEHYELSSLSVSHLHSDFKLNKFAAYIHGANILPIIQALEESAYHLERNGNAQMIFTDLSFKLTRLLHQKAA